MNSSKVLFVLFLALIAWPCLNAQEQTYPESAKQDAQNVYRGAACNFDEFTKAVLAVQERRRERILTASEFVKLAEKKGTIIIDARSDVSFELMHVKGSVNVPYPNFSEELLQKSIPSKHTVVLIYCRNNIVNATFAKVETTAFGDYVFKKAPAAGLNIPVAVTLFIYGYENVYELDEIVDPMDCPIEFVWSEKYKELSSRTLEFTK